MNKIIKGNSILNLTVFTSVIINIILLLVYLKNDSLNIKWYMILFISVNIIDYFLARDSMHYFEIDSSNLYVKNSWSYFMKKYKLSEINKIWYKKVLNAGLRVYVETENYKDKFGCNTLNLKDIDDLIFYVESLSDKN